MKINTKIYKILKEIKVSDFDRILTKLQNSNELNTLTHSILIFGQGGQTRNFYKQIANDKDIQLFWTGWSGPKWSLIFSFIPGQSGLLELKNKERIKEVYEKVGELSYCGLYYLPKTVAKNLINEVKLDYLKFQDEQKIDAIIKNEKDFFQIDTDFDYHAEKRDGEFYHIEIKFGKGLNKKIENILRIFET